MSAGELGNLIVLSCVPLVWAAAMFAFPVASLIGGGALVAYVGIFGPAFVPPALTDSAFASSFVNTMSGMLIGGGLSMIATGGILRAILAALRTRNGVDEGEGSWR